MAEPTPAMSSPLGPELFCDTMKFEAAERMNVLAAESKNIQGLSGGRLVKVYAANVPANATCCRPAGYRLKVGNATVLGAPFGTVRVNSTARRSVYARIAPWRAASVWKSKEISE